MFKRVMAAGLLLAAGLGWWWLPGLKSAAPPEAAKKQAEDEKAVRKEAEKAIKRADKILEDNLDDLFPGRGGLPPE